VRTFCFFLSKDTTTITLNIFYNQKDRFTKSEITFSNFITIDSK